MGNAQRKDSPFEVEDARDRYRKAFRNGDTEYLRRKSWALARGVQEAEKSVAVARNSAMSEHVLRAREKHAAEARRAHEAVLEMLADRALGAAEVVAPASFEVFIKCTNCSREVRVSGIGAPSEADAGRLRCIHCGHRGAQIRRAPDGGSR